VNIDLCNHISGHFRFLLHLKLTRHPRERGNLERLGPRLRGDDDTQSQGYFIPLQ